MIKNSKDLLYLWGVDGFKLSNSENISSYTATLAKTKNDNAWFIQIKVNTISQCVQKNMLYFLQLVFYPWIMIHLWLI